MMSHVAGGWARDNPEMPERQFSYLRNNIVVGDYFSYARQLIYAGNMTKKVAWSSVVVIVIQ